jgi:hypothetical protein
MDWPQASRFTEDDDVVLVGYPRGRRLGAARLPEVDSALRHSTDFLSEASFRADGDAFRDCVNRLTDEGVDLAGYGLAQALRPAGDRRADRTLRRPVLEGRQLQHADRRRSPN